jgi:hypothetical protein
MIPFKLISGLDKNRIFNMNQMNELGFQSINEIKWFCLQYFEGESDYKLIFTEENVQPDILILNDNFYDVLKDTLSMLNSI